MDAIISETGGVRKWKSEKVRRYRFAGVFTLSRFTTFALLVLSLVPAARAADPENCLLCHRYRGLVRVVPETEQIQTFYVDPSYYDHALGPHARLRCTDCHRREEVATIPHQPVTPVNCTNTCHLLTSAQTEVTFSHADVMTALDMSVHDQDTLDDANELLASPLREGQSRCLLCHDEPTFRWAETTWAEQEAHVDRCGTCHTERLPLDTRYYFWHVHARSREARHPRDLVRVCANCHSNPAILEHFDNPDTVASYLASFHGKGLLLGSEETAHCLDCHVAELANVHLMQSHTDPDSPTHVSRLPDTCRSTECHPAAGEAIGTAAIHLDLATDRGIEFAIGALFFLLILSTFGPSLVLVTLELLQIVVGRHDPEHHRHAGLASRVMADPRGRQRLKRFTPHQRVQHWFLFATFTALVITGFPIKFADRTWAAWMIENIGSLSAARLIHRWAGTLLIAGFTYHIAYVAVHTFRRWRRGPKGLVGTFLDLPMVMNLSDLKQMRDLLLFLLFRRKGRPPAGRFTLEEKFEYFGVFWGSILLGITGVLMWAHAWTTEVMTGRVLTIANLVHSFEAYLALLHVGVLHMVTVIFSPVVFPVSPAMVTGDTPEEKMAEAHAGLLENVAKDLDIQSGQEVSHG